MNEVGMLRTQLAAERAHLHEIATACAAAGGATPAHHQYLDRTLGEFALRDERLAQLLAAGTGTGAAGGGRAALTRALAEPGNSREMLARLPRAAAGAPAWQAFAQYLAGAWSTHRERLEALLTQESGAAEWRAMAALDADAILEERARFARARGARC